VTDAEQLAQYRQILVDVCKEAAQAAWDYEDDLRFQQPEFSALLARVRSPDPAEQDAAIRALVPWFMMSQSKYARRYAIMLIDSCGTEQHPKRLEDYLGHADPAP
jgi:hypothetical protein